MIYVSLDETSNSFKNDDQSSNVSGLQLYFNSAFVHTRSILFDTLKFWRLTVVSAGLAEVSWFCSQAS
jgi:hypothetical protein